MKEIYKPSTWADYARAHQACVSLVQLELYQYAAKRSYGNVIDFGCGSGRLAAIMHSNPAVKQFTGIDSSRQMIDAAKQLATTLSLTNTRFLNQAIDHSFHEEFDCGVSINSFYTWPEPTVQLDAIHKSLKPGGQFLLATPNQNLDMPALIKRADLELTGNPLYSDFKNANEQLAANLTANFLPMNELVVLLVNAGFHIQSCNQSYFNGGMNTIITSV